jgi:hypothetical protein
MSLPRPVEPLLKAVWDLCDPKQATAGRHYRPEFGVPPRELRIYQASHADWERGFCKRPFVAGWRFTGGLDVENIASDDLPNYSVKPSGMYWPVGEIDFIIDMAQKKALFTFVLGPRYGRGYMVTFESSETLALLPENGRILWVS